MHENNISYVFLLGFPNLHSYNIIFFLLLLNIYLFSICGNVIIIALVSMSKTLHSPMYFFITIISFQDILMATNILPNLLHIVLHDGGTMSLAACITQFFVFAISESSECLILMVMSYDRYLAICNPLRYNTIVSKELCGISAILAWSLSVFLMGLHVVHICKLDFCGPSFIDHFFCDFPPILKLSCSDTSLIFIQGALFGIIIITFPFTMIIVSYVYIITTILNIRSNSGRQKAFSTCSSHLTVVCIFFGTLISVYVIPTKGHLLATSKILSLLYTVAIPLLNPFIYSMRNKDFKRAFVKWKVSYN